MPVRALLFDLDDTLIETHDAHAAALRECCLRACQSYPGWTVERFEEAFTRAYRMLESQLETGDVRFASQSVFRTAAWREVLRACSPAADLGEELAALYMQERRRRFAAYEDVPPALARLAERYPLVLVTNGLSDIQREKIAAVGLDRWIRHCAISGELGSWKPDPAIFHHALKLAGAAPADAVMIGDSLERDIQAAGALGLRTVWIRRYPHQAPLPGIVPDAEVPHLRGFEELLARWN